MFCKCVFPQTLYGQLGVLLGDAPGRERHLSRRCYSPVRASLSEEKQLGTHSERFSLEESQNRKVIIVWERINLKVRTDNATFSSTIQTAKLFTKRQLRTAWEDSPQSPVFEMGAFWISKRDSQKNLGTARCYNKAPERQHLHLWKVYLLLRDTGTFIAVRTTSST